MSAQSTSTESAWLARLIASKDNDTAAAQTVYSRRRLRRVIHAHTITTKRSIARASFGDSLFTVNPTMTLPFSHEIAAVAPLARTSNHEHVAELPADLLELLYRQMRVLAGPRHDLDDLVQCAALRLLRALPHFEGRSTLSTFAYGVAYRTMLGEDRWFRRWSRRFAFAEDQPDREPEASVEDSEQAADRARRAESLHRALAKLAPAKRAVIVLHDLEGLDTKEVATIVETNERTVRSRLRDGRKKLAALLRTDPVFGAVTPW
jgi:RNA polymerase sigma-70 factor (ECF subfamily)